MVYVAATMRNFTCLSLERDIRQVPVWKYCSQLILKESLHHFRSVNDALFGSYMCMFDKKLEK